MSVQVSHSHMGWIATDSNGNEATATFDEGKDKAIERVKSMSNARVIQRVSKPSDDDPA